jgi:hypothetical protein
MSIQKNLKHLAKDVEKTYKKVEAEVGVKINEIRSMWTSYPKG